MAWRAASWATWCAAKAVLLREPLKPTRPALDQPSRFPCMSVIVTWVLLKVARMLATPTAMFLAPLALTIFFPADSSANRSAAVGALPATISPGAALGASAPSGALAGAALGAAPSAAGAAAALAGLSAFGSFAFFGFASSAIKNLSGCQSWR